MIIVRIGVAGFFESSKGAAAIAESVADGAERKPCGRKGGCHLDSLDQNIGGGGKIAARGVIERPFVAPVGDEVAG